MVYICTCCKPGTCTCICACVIYIYIYIYIHMYIYTYTYIHTCMYRHTYIHTYIHTCICNVAAQIIDPPPRPKLLAWIVWNRGRLWVGWLWIWVALIKLEGNWGGRGVWGLACVEGLRFSADARVDSKITTATKNLSFWRLFPPAYSPLHNRRNLRPGTV